MSVSLEPNSDHRSEGSDDFVLLPMPEYTEDGQPSGEESAVNDQSETGAEIATSSLIDPSDAFELIQSEHRLLRDELCTQNGIFAARLEEMEELQKIKTREMAALQNELEALKLQLQEKDEHEAHLKDVINNLEQYSKKNDCLTAQMLMAEEVMNYQNSALRDASFGTSDSNLHSVRIADLSMQLLDYETEMKQVKDTLLQTEQSNQKLYEQIDDLSRINTDLRGLVTALQTQAEIDKAEWAASREELEKEISVLKEEKPEQEPVKMTPEQKIRSDLIKLGEKMNILTHTETTKSRFVLNNSKDSSDCPRCRLPMFGGQAHPCPSVIDNLD